MPLVPCNCKQSFEGSSGVGNILNNYPSLVFCKRVSKATPGSDARSGRIAMERKAMRIPIVKVSSKGSTIEIDFSKVTFVLSL